jgi:hypothetical protein
MSVLTPLTAYFENAFDSFLKTKVQNQPNLLNRWSKFIMLAISYACICGIMKQSIFSRRMLPDFLAQLQDSTEDYLSIYLKSSSFPLHDTSLIAGLKNFPPELTEALASDEVLREAHRRGTGLAIFWSRSGNKLIILPPFPIQEDKVMQGRPDISLLLSLVEKERVLGIMLINWGSYAVGVFKGEKLVESKTGTGYIHKKIKKGGSSQKRFARRTVDQKDHFLRRVANHIEEIFKGHAPENIFYGGNRLIFNALLRESSYLEGQANKISPRTINLRYADREAMLKSLQDVNGSVVFSF